MTEEEIFKTAKEIADKADELKGETRDVDREMAYQQFTDLQTFLNMLECLEMRIKYDGPRNALCVVDVYKHNIERQVESIRVMLEAGEAE